MGGVTETDLVLTPLLPPPWPAIDRVDPRPLTLPYTQSGSTLPPIRLPMPLEAGLKGLKKKLRCQFRSKILSKVLKKIQKEKHKGKA